MVNKNRFTVTLTISSIIVVGFVLSVISSILSFQSLFRKDVEAVSELTSENIFVNINNLMDRPINVSITMAHDTFLRDFMNKEAIGGLSENSLCTMTKYLASYQQKYQFDSVFLVSVKTGNYYHYKNGIDRVMTPNNPENQWYFDFLADSSDCSLNVDNDETKNDVITIFVNCKLYDENNNIIGIVGVGMETPYIQQFLSENETNYGIHAYLIDVKGNIQLSSTLTEFEQVNLFNNPIFHDMSGAIGDNTAHPNQRWYHSSTADGYIITRYVPNLNWYLVVEKNVEDFAAKLFAQLALDLVFLFLVVVVVIIITTKIIKKYDNQLICFAETDQLTGIRNRTSYERAIFVCAQKLGSYQNFGIGICDLNQLKATNDRYGHQAGDAYLKSFSAMLCHAFPHCPVFRIGGDEFALIFINLTEETVLKCWDDLLQAIELQKKDGGISMSAAFGYAFLEAGRKDTINQLFKAADNKMYQSKKQMKRAD
ncbi:MAG: diguanylate cyclase [Clostridia bacterium]